MCAPHVQLLVVCVWTRNETIIYQYSDGLFSAAAVMVQSMFFQVDVWNKSHWKDELEKNILNVGQQK